MIAVPRLTSKAAVALLILFVVPMLTGCGGSNSVSSPPPPPPPPTPTEFLYVSGSVGELFGFSIDPNSGVLSPIRSGNPMGAGPGGIVRMAADPNGTNIYVSRAALDGSENLMVLFWRAATQFHDAGDLGTWSDLGQILTVAPGKLAVDPSAKNLYVIPDPSANLSEVLSFSITPGSPHSPHLVALPTPMTAVPGVPQDITVDQSGNYVYLTFAGAAGVQVAGYSRDQTTGALTNLPNSPFGNTGGNDSQGIRITSGGTFAVIANAATNNVSVMSLDGTTGMLTNIGSSPFAAGANPLAVAVDPSGKFAFVTNEGDNTLSAYAIGAGGELSIISGSPFSVTSQPQGVTVDPLGQFVYVDTADGHVYGFSLNTGAASLTPITGSPFSANGTLRDIVVLKQ